MALTFVLSALSDLVASIPSALGEFWAALTFQSHSRLFSDLLVFLKSYQGTDNVFLTPLTILSCLYFLSKWFLVFPIVSKLSRKQLLSSAQKGNVIAHRGSRMEGLPENTIAAFKDAIRVGASIVELDVWLTRDGKVVVFHDETLHRMTQGNNGSKIHELSYAELPKIVPTSPQSERVEAHSSSGECERIPLLSEVLAIVPPNVAVIVEVKQDSSALIDLVHEQIVEAGEERKANLFWFSLQEGINKQLRKRDQSIPTICSVSGMLRVFMLYYTGLLPFCSVPDAVFGITVEAVSLTRVRNEKALAGLPDIIKQVLAYFLRGKPPRMLLQPGLFAHLRKRGIPVWFLGCLDEKDLKCAIKSGATAVLTDKVNWAVKFIRSRGLAFMEIHEP